MGLSWILLSVGASVLWGLTYVIDQRILQTLTPLQLLMMTSLFGFFFFGICSYFAGDIGTLKENVEKTGLDWLFAVFVISNCAGLLIVASIKASNASLAAIIEISYPVFTVAFGYLMIKDYSLHWSFAAGSVLIFAGAFIIIHFVNKGY